MSNVESSLRRYAKRRGFRVWKSRDRSLHSDNRGEFLLSDWNNYVRMGSKFDASLPDIMDFLRGEPLLSER